MTTAHTGNYRPDEAPQSAIWFSTTRRGATTRRQSNLRYFEQNVVKASAHYFVDDLGWMQSVDDGDTAWSVGTAGIYVQKHPECRNENSISIELCCRYAAGQYAFSKKTVRNAAHLTRMLMTKYDIPIGNVLRHYDVVSKHCPAPWVDDESQWIAFRKRVEEELDMTKQELLSLANTGDHPSDWAAEAASWAKQMGLIQGDGEGKLRLAAAHHARGARRHAVQVLAAVNRKRLNTQEEESVLAYVPLFFCIVLQENFYRKQLHAALSIL